MRLLCPLPQDVIYPIGNQRVMTYIGGGAENATAFLEYLGLLKDLRFPALGSPF